MSEHNYNQHATGITYSEQVSDEMLEKLEDFDSIDDGDFIDWCTEPGRYLVQCISVKTKETNDKASENILFKILDGNPSSQKGKSFLEHIYHSAVDRSLKIAKRMGVWTAEQHQAFLEAMRAGDVATGPDFLPCVGKQFVVTLKSETYNEKEKIKMDYIGIWQANDSRVADFVASLKSGGSSGSASSNATTKSTVNAASNGQSKGSVKEPVKPATNGKATSRTTSSGSGGARTTRQPAAAGDLNEL